MAQVVGCICTSHVPAIGGALAKGLQSDPYWKPFFDGFPPVRAWLDEVKPDIAVVFYNDHGLNFFLDTVPTFAVGAADEYSNEDEGWGIPALGIFAGAPKFSWHIIESLVRGEFDPASCQKMLVDHAFSLPMQLLWPDRFGRQTAQQLPHSHFQYRGGTSAAREHGNRDSWLTPPYGAGTGLSPLILSPNLPRVRAT
jgi:protocatechuate 4,5-dioxygenase beta chain